MRVLAPIALLAVVVSVSFIGERAAREASDLAESDFRSQTAPNYEALERLQRANIGLTAVDNRPVSASGRAHRGRHRG